MVRPTPGTDSQTSKKTPAAEAPRISAPVADEATRAKEFLELLGRGDHPDAERDPLDALYQVAVDFQCSAYGYRELYLRKRPDKA